MRQLNRADITIFVGGSQLKTIFVFRSGAKVVLILRTALSSRSTILIKAAVVVAVNESTFFNFF
jgi:hypothetical protein